MNPSEIVTRLLEDNPDDVDPKMEMLRNSPEQEMVDLVDGLWNLDTKVMAYSRNPPNANFLLRFHNRVRDFESVREWFHRFLVSQGLNVEPGAIDVKSLGERMYLGTAVSITFPMDGPAVPYRDYRLGI